ALVRPPCGYGSSPDTVLFDRDGRPRGTPLGVRREGAEGGAVRWSTDGPRPSLLPGYGATAPQPRGVVAGWRRRGGAVLGLARDARPREAELLEGLLVHEDDLVARVVEVLDALHLGVDARELLARAEGAVDDCARAERLQLRADERAALPRLHVLELGDAPGLAVELDVHAVLELVRGDLLRRGGGV